MNQSPVSFDDSNMPNRDIVANLIASDFACRLIAIARERLGRRFQSKVSAEDIVQSALKSFFRRFNDFTIDFECPNELWGLLVVITLRKCSKWEDILGAEKRDVSRERSLTGDSQTGQSRFGLKTREPSPEEIAIFQEQLDRIMKPLNKRQREMIRMRLSGMEIDEIATAIQSSKRTVSRVIAMVKTILQDAESSDKSD